MQKVALVFLLFSSLWSNAQERNQPLLLDRSVLSGVGLEKIDLKDEPEKDFHQKRLYSGEDISIYVVSTETWNNDFKNFWFDEFIYMYHGEALIKPENGRSMLFHSGDYFFAPKGFTGEWEIRAGNHLHYELSVITTHRADSTRISAEDDHQLFNRSTLSGAHIDLNEVNPYHEILRKGVELTVTLHAERPSSIQMSDQSKERLVHLLSGQISIVDINEEEHTFYTGDFFVLPKNCQGEWKSNGHGMIKYLTVEKSK